MLDIRRAALRVWLRGLGETWIEDPANDDPGSPAATLAGGLARARPAAEAAVPHPRLGDVREDAGGALRVPAAAFDGAPQALRLAGALALCAGGRTRPRRRPHWPIW